MRVTSFIREKQDIFFYDVVHGMELYVIVDGQQGYKRSIFWVFFLCNNEPIPDEVRYNDCNIEKIWRFTKYHLNARPFNKV